MKKNLNFDPYSNVCIPVPGPLCMRGIKVCVGWPGKIFWGATSIYIYRGEKHLYRAQGRGTGCSADGETSATCIIYGEEHLSGSKICSDKRNP